MSQAGREPGGLANLNGGTGLSEIMSAFVAHGGQLAGARRWPENPLALTHVRWHGPAGQLLDAVRHPGDEAWLLQGERDAWVQLALHYPATAQPTMPGPNSPWMPLNVDRNQAQQMLAAMVRPRSANTPAPGYPGGGFGAPSPRSGYSGRFVPNDSSFGSQPTSYPGTARADLRSPSRLSDAPLGSSRSSGTQNSGSYAAGPGQVPEDPISQITGGWSSSRPPTQDVVIIPCVEVELPPVAANPGPNDFASDYARDIAVHFARAARTIPQVRELRAWMRGDRLALAARMVLGTGGRPLTRVETDGAIQLLADVLVQRTLPFSWIGLADAAEWQAGSQMPE